METKEESCLVLDFLPHGHSDRRHMEPIAQVIGTKYYTILEVVSREDIDLKQGQEIYIGDGKRDDTKFIKGQIDYNSLTNMSKTYLEVAVQKLVDLNEERIIEMFNKAGSVTPRMHSLDLIPGLGKKLLLDIIQMRSKDSFKSFEDLETRVKSITSIKKAVIKRILDEIKENQKYYLFVLKKQKRNDDIFR